MSERPSYLPELPEPWATARPPDCIPDTATAAAVASQPAVAEDVAAAPTGQAEQPPVAALERRGNRPYETLTGRVAALPTFRTTPKNHQLVASFPLAVHETKDGDVVTVYHQVIAFGARAEKVRESVKLGEEIQVAAYKHESTTRAGKPKVEYYAGAIRRPKGATTGSAEPPQPEEPTGL